MNSVVAPTIRKTEDELGLQKLLDRFDALSTDDFTKAAPFPYLVMDNAFEPGTTDTIHRQLPRLPDSNWDKSNDAVEVKWRSNWKSEYDIPEPARELVRFLNSGQFLRSLARVTGIPNLIPDPYYTGGGFNLLKRGGLLDVHVDGNWHDAMRVHRRLNLLVYLNSNWKDEWGGKLGFYDAEGINAIEEIAPIGNRLVVFETHDKSYHGHPEPLTCPDNEHRTSIILYYYTSAARPSEQVVVAEPHSALWRSRDWHDKRGQKSRA